MRGWRHRGARRRPWSRADALLRQGRLRLRAAEGRDDAPPRRGRGGRVRRAVEGGLRGHLGLLPAPAGRARRWEELDPVDLQNIADASGIDFGPLVQGSQADPSQYLLWLSALGPGVTKIGEEEIRGVPTSRYRAVVDLNLLESQAPPGKEAEWSAYVQTLRDQIGLDFVPVDVENVEQAGPLGRLDLVAPEHALARVGVEPPDLQRDVHRAPSSLRPDQIIQGGHLPRGRRLHVDVDPEVEELRRDDCARPVGREPVLVVEAPDEPVVVHPDLDRDEVQADPVAQRLHVGAPLGLLAGRGLALQEVQIDDRAVARRRDTADLLLADLGDPRAERAQPEQVLGRIGLAALHERAEVDAGGVRDVLQVEPDPALPTAERARRELVVDRGVHEDRLRPPSERALLALDEAERHLALPLLEVEGALA